VVRLGMVYRETNPHIHAIGYHLRREIPVGLSLRTRCVIARTAMHVQEVGRTRRVDVVDCAI
jgi:hypothetical protein